MWSAICQLERKYENLRISESNYRNRTFVELQENLFDVDYSKNRAETSSTGKSADVTVFEMYHIKVKFMIIDTHQSGPLYGGVRFL